MRCRSIFERSRSLPMTLVSLISEINQSINQTFFCPILLYPFGLPMGALAVLLAFFIRRLQKQPTCSDACVGPVLAMIQVFQQQSSCIRLDHCHWRPRCIYAVCSMLPM